MLRPKGIFTHVYIIHVHNYVHNMTIHDSIIVPRVMHFSAFIVIVSLIVMYKGTSCCASLHHNSFSLHVLVP